MLPKLSGIRQPGMRKAGTSAGSGSSAAAAITLADAGGYYTTDNAEAALQQLGPLLAAPAPTAATVTTADAGTYYTTDNVEASLQQLGPLLSGTFPTQPLGAKLSYLVDDNTTNTAPDLFVLGHTTSGTAAANFGGTLAVELESAGGTKRRAMTDVTKWTTATNGSEVATRTVQLMNAGTLADVVAFSIVETNFPAVGTAAAPSVTIGATASKLGFHGTSGYLCFDAGGVQSLYLNNTGVYASVPLVVPAGTAGAPGLALPGSSGLYNITNGMGLSAIGSNVLSLAKQAAAFVLTPPVPAANSTASTEFVAADFNMSRTTTWATGALTTQREVLFRAPTYAFAGASTITDAATVAIAAAPIAGANATITNPWNLWTQSGASRFDISDAATTTAPDVALQVHLSSGTPGAGFGLTNAIELHSSTNVRRRAFTQVVEWQTATNAAEVAQFRLRLMKGGAAVADAFTLFPNSAGSLTTPTAVITDQSSYCVVALAQANGIQGILRVRNSSPPGFEYLSNGGTHTFYSDMTATAIKYQMNGTGVGWFATAPVAKQTGPTLNITNNVTAGGTDGTIANFTDLTTYATDAAAIRNDIYQLARGLKFCSDALRAYGLLT
jgi:hypothetical protein